MNLRFGCSGTNGPPGYQISSVLRTDSIQKFASGRQAHFRDFQQESAGDAEALVNLETAVHVWVVDEAFPSDGGAGLFEVDTHDDEKIIFCGFCVVIEKFGVFKGCLDVVH